MSIRSFATSNALIFPYTADLIEALEYDYTLRGSLNGINKKYGNGVNTLDRWFGMKPNYDKGSEINQVNALVKSSTARLLMIAR